MCKKWKFSGPSSELSQKLWGVAQKQMIEQVMQAMQAKVRETLL